MRLRSHISGWVAAVLFITILLMHPTVSAGVLVPLQLHDGNSRGMVEWQLP